MTLAMTSVVIEAPLQAGDRPPLRSLNAGSIALKLPEPPVYCLECGVDCTALHAVVFLTGWRPFCITHARALAQKQYRAAGRELRRLGHV